MEFIEHLASIEDPGQRATEAIEVFGARGGAGLANAIRPGMQGLDDFKVSAEEMIAFGDSGNDIAMLRYAGFGVAMGNAREEVKAAYLEGGRQQVS